MVGEETERLKRLQTGSLLQHFHSNRPCKHVVWKHPLLQANADHIDECCTPVLKCSPQADFRLIKTDTQLEPITFPKILNNGKGKWSKYPIKRRRI